MGCQRTNKVTNSPGEHTRSTDSRSKEVVRRVGEERDDLGIQEGARGSLAVILGRLGKLEPRSMHAGHARSEVLL